MNDKKQEYISQLIDKKADIAQKVSMLAEALANMNPHDSLHKIVNSMRSESHVVKTAYENLCRAIESEVFSLLNQIHDKKIDSVKMDQELLSKEKESNRYFSIYAKVPPLKNLQNDPDYNYFLDKYQEGVTLSREIADLQLKLRHLLDIQKSLDNIFASSMIETDYWLRKIDDTMKTFRCMKTPELLNSYKSKYCFYKNLQKMSEEKNMEFEEFLKKLDHSLLK